MMSAGFPIEVRIEYVGLVQQSDQIIEARKEILKEQRKQLAAKNRRNAKNTGFIGPQN
jgi:DNA-binding transcriptional MerR regulator